MASNPTILGLQEMSLRCTEMCRDEIVYIFDQIDANVVGVDFLSTIKMLTRFMSERSQSVFLLISWDKIWDAEIILRSFYESSIKIWFLAKSNDKETLLNEFWGTLGTINRRKRAHKARLANDFIIQQKGDADEVFSALYQNSNEEEKISRVERKRIEQKWSFSEIVIALEKLSPQQDAIVGSQVLLHVYGLSSHFLHADSSALEVLIDHKSRGTEEYRLLHDAHLARITSDLVNLWYFTAIILNKGLGLNRSIKNDITKEYQRFSEIAQFFEDRFRSNQADFYQA